MKVFHDLIRQLRCVRIRRDFEEQQERYRDVGCAPALCGTRGLVDRMSFRTKNRKKLLMQMSIRDS